MLHQSLARFRAVRLHVRFEAPRSLEHVLIVPTGDLLCQRHGRDFRRSGSIAGRHPTSHLRRSGMGRDIGGPEIMAKNPLVVRR